MLHFFIICYFALEYNSYLYDAELINNKNIHILLIYIMIFYNNDPVTLAHINCILCTSYNRGLCFSNFR